MYVCMYVFRWHTGCLIRQDPKWIPEVPQKTHLCVPTSDLRFGLTGFVQSDKSQSNVERARKTLAYAICTELSHTQLCNFQNNQKTVNFVKVPESPTVHSSSNPDSGFKLNRGVNKFSRYMESRFAGFWNNQASKFKAKMWYYLET